MRTLAVITAGAIAVLASSPASAQNSNSSGPASSNSNNSGPAPSNSNSSGPASVGDSSSSVIRQGTLGATQALIPGMDNTPGPHMLSSGQSPATSVMMAGVGPALNAIGQAALGPNATAWQKAKTAAVSNFVGAFTLGPVPAITAGAYGFATSLTGSASDWIAGPVSPKDSAAYQAAQTGVNIGMGALGTAAVAGVAVLLGAAEAPVLVPTMVVAGVVTAVATLVDKAIDRLPKSAATGVPGNTDSNTNQSRIDGSPTSNAGSNTNTSGPAPTETPEPAGPPSRSAGSNTSAGGPAENANQSPGTNTNQSSTGPLPSSNTASNSNASGPAPTETPEPSGPPSRNAGSNNPAENANQSPATNTNQSSSGPLPSSNTASNSNNASGPAPDPGQPFLPQPPASQPQPGRAPRPDPGQASNPGVVGRPPKVASNTPQSPPSQPSAQTSCSAFPGAKSYTCTRTRDDGSPDVSYHCLYPDAVPEAQRICGQASEPKYAGKWIEGGGPAPPSPEPPPPPKLYADLNLKPRGTDAQTCESEPPYLPWGGYGSATITVSGDKPCGIGWHDTGATILDSMSVASHPAHGTLTPKDQHLIIFTPTPGYKGQDSFTLSMQEHNGGRRATLSVRVGVTIK